MKKNRAFTLVEILVSTSLLLLLVTIIGGFIHQVSSITRKTRSDIEGFQNARLALDAITSKLSLAELNPYWDYYDQNNTRITDYLKQEPFSYGFYSELQFICTPLKSIGIDSPTSSHGVFFQAQIGYTRDKNLAFSKNLLNTVGYYCGAYNEALPFSFLKSTKRYALMELMPPAEDVNPYSQIFQSSPTENSNLSWFSNYISTTNKGLYTSPVADNILSVVFFPHYPVFDDISTIQIEKRKPANCLTPNFFYDSRKISASGSPILLSRENGSTWTTTWLHRLPPLIDVYIIAMDEATAQKISDFPDHLKSVFKGDLFTNPNQLSSDLEIIIQRSKKEKINIRWFKKTVILYASESG